jgi:RNA polymerase sigma-70 factor, ECF subfamily
LRVAKRHGQPSILLWRLTKMSSGSDALVPDSDLIARVRHGDVEAFGQLAARYDRSLLAIALAKMRNFHEAEDVVQATLLLAFRRLGTLRDPGKFGPWLMQIARSQVVEAVRARRIPESIPPNGPEQPSGDDPTQNTIENEHLLMLVARLPEHEGTLIGLRYFDGHSMAEIAAISTRPLGTVTKQLSRAIARLRSWYDKENRR